MKLTMWRVVVVLNTYTKFGENSLLHLSLIVKWQGRRLPPKSGSDRPNFRDNRIQLLNEHGRLVEHEFL